MPPPPALPAAGSAVVRPEDQRRDVGRQGILHYVEAAARAPSRRGGPVRERFRGVAEEGGKGDVIVASSSAALLADADGIRRGRQAVPKEEDVVLAGSGRPLSTAAARRAAANVPVGWSLLEFHVVAQPISS